MTKKMRFLATKPKILYRRNYILMAAKVPIKNLGSVAENEFHKIIPKGDPSVGEKVESLRGKMILFLRFDIALNFAI